MAAVALSYQTVVLGGQWTLAQFPPQAPVITFETGSTALPTINGIHLSGGDAAFSSRGFGQQVFGNLSTVNGYTSLSVTFDQPQQAVGAYLIDIDYWYGASSVSVWAYDSSNNYLWSTVQQLPAWGSPPQFLGIGGATTNISRVEWRVTGGFFGLDNLIYAPGPSVAITNVQSRASQFTLSFQTIAGRTNIVEQTGGFSSGGWTGVTNFLGDGGNRQVSVSTTNSPAGFFRVRVQ